MENITTKKTVVFGASLKTNRYSNYAIHKLRDAGHPTIGIGLRTGKVRDVDIVKFGTKVSDVHTITIYMNAIRQNDYINEILSLKPKRIIFNPGAENHELYQKAASLGIEVEDACTLVLLSMKVY